MLLSRLNLDSLAAEPAHVTSTPSPPSYTDLRVRRNQGGPRTQVTSNLLQPWSWHYTGAERGRSQGRAVVPKSNLKRLQSLLVSGEHLHL